MKWVAFIVLCVTTTHGNSTCTKRRLPTFEESQTACMFVAKEWAVKEHMKDGENWLWLCEIDNYSPKEFKP